MQILTAIIAALQAIPAIRDLINLLVNAWESWEDGMTEKQFQKRIKQRAMLVKRIKAAQNDEERKEYFRKLVEHRYRS